MNLCIGVLIAVGLPALVWLLLFGAGNDRLPYEIVQELQANNYDITGVIKHKDYWLVTAVRDEKPYTFLVRHGKNGYTVHPQIEQKGRWQ